MTTRLERFRRALGRRRGVAYPVLRAGLGIVILLAGAHKLVDPGAWTVYVAMPFEAIWPLPWAATMVANGLLEVVIGLLLIVDRYATLAAAIVALSLLGVLVNLVVVSVLTGEFVDVLIRDLGLFALAVGVTLLSADRD